MFGLFKKKQKTQEPKPLQDLNGLPLYEGDQVTALRYDLGISTLIMHEGIYHYQSNSDKRLVPYVKMIDAITGYQKVTKSDKNIEP